MGGNFGVGGSGGASGTPSFHEIFAKAREQQAQQQQSGGFPFGGGAVNPFASGGAPSSSVSPALRGEEFIDMGSLMQMRDKFQQAFTPEMRQQVQSTLQGMGNGGMPGGMGMMAFGIGQNENGKRVAKAAKVMVDNNGNVTKEYKEQQLDPDDMLPKHDRTDASTNYDDATEVQFEEGGSKSSSTENISAMEVEFDTPADDSKKK
eukprot:GILI01033958.1.p1 GENE.GILI01033958.1~~GILI01033958.1.p1  ORF type:complete len:205 (+),score=74.13 GILI01033958.1:73-687(+)